MFLHRFFSIYYNRYGISILNAWFGSFNKRIRTRLRFYGVPVYEHLIWYPTANSLTYFWSFGSLAAIFLIIQLITGVILVIHYKPSTLNAFASVAHLITDVPSGWIIRYLHSNGASIFFIVIYVHIARGLYYGSFISPRNLIWISGIIIFLLLIGTAFIGYVLPWGQISFWGATVITNLISAIPWVGERIVYWIWGSFSIGDATLNRFFSLHYFLPFVIAVAALLHLYLLHIIGSSNAIGLNPKYDILRISFYPFYYIKDIYSVLLFFWIYFYLVFFAPNLLGHSDNYMLANSIITPVHIVPEWYFLPFYAILRSIPNKFGGVIAIVGAIFSILVYATLITFQAWVPVASFNIRSLYFINGSNVLYWWFIIDFIILGIIGGRPIEIPYLLISQWATCFFFFYWLFAPIIYWWEYLLLTFAYKIK